MKNITRPIVFFALFLSVLSQLKAQDPRFSQYYASPWNLNPAMTGLFNGSWRITGNYRDQWGSILAPEPFRTYSAAFEQRIQVGLRNDYASFGIGAMHDEAGTARFMQNKAHVGGAFLKQLSGGPRRADHYLSAGAQIGMGQNSIDWSRLWFSRQFDNGTETPDLNASSGESGANAASNAWLDFNAGLMWYALFENGGTLYAGGAMHHLNNPVISLTGNDSETLYSRWTVHAGGEFPLSHNLSLLPGVLVMQQGPSFESDFGMSVRYSNNDLNELALRAGAWARVGNRLDNNIQADALTIVGMLELNRCVLGISYDVTVSNLSIANNSRGAFELSFSYYHPGTRRTRVQCPNF